MMFSSYTTVSSTQPEKTLSPFTFSSKIPLLTITMLSFVLFVSTAPALADNDDHHDKDRYEDKDDRNDDYHHRMGRKKHHKKVDNLEDAQEIVESIYKRFSKRMEKLRDKLSITNPQEAAWKNFIDARRMMIPSSEDLLRMSQLREQGNTPAAAQSHLENMRQHLNKAQKAVNSYDALYQLSSDTQKKILARMRHHSMGGFFGKGAHRGDKKRRAEKSDD